MKAPKERIQHRLKIIRGQLNGLEKMVNEDRYCMDIFTLSLSIQRALKEMDQLVMKDHIKGCVIEAAKAGKAEKVSKELEGIFEIIRK
uniref:Metal-sensitive transcriptional regulator n=1 Tax=candidate division WWE3 bacterium TaxID=2053526 RepID=A0A831YYL1_UNCKA